MPTYFLDACVPIYAAGREHPYRDPCWHLLRGAARGHFRTATSVEVLQEIVCYVDCTGRRQAGITLARELLADVDLLLPVQPTDLTRALVLMEAHAFLSAHDAIHAAVMEGADLTHIVTADRHFERLPSLTRVDPSDLAW